VSRQIENELLKAISQVGAEKIYGRAFSTFYESDRKLMAWLPANASAGNDYADYALIFNTATSTWTRWDKRARSAMIAMSDNRLYVGYDNVYKERKAMTAKDFIDYAEELDVVSVDPDGTYFSWGGTVEPAVGDIVYQSADPWADVTDYGVVTSVDTGTSTAYLDRGITIAVGPAVLLNGYECTVRWTPQAGGDPTTMKQFTQAVVFWGRVTVPTVEFAFSTDMSPGFIADDFECANPDSAWGLFGWGGSGWGDTSTESSSTRLYIPGNKQRGRMLYVRMNWQAQAAYAEWQGLSIEGRAYTSTQAQR
jgi:hypothetical protein